MAFHDNSLRVNFNSLSIHSGLEFLVKFKCFSFEKYDKKSCPYVHFKVYGVAMANTMI